jgi:hypothetical protein
VTGTEQFISSLVRALAWPAAVVGLALVFRGQIAQLLEALRELRAGPVLARFDRVLAKVEREVPTEMATLPAETSLTAELGELADEAPDAAILEAFAQVEKRLRTILEANGIERINAGAQGLANIAAVRGLISPETHKAVDGIAVLRNLAAHGRGMVTPDRAREYLALVDAILFSLQQRGEGADRD